MDVITQMNHLGDAYRDLFLEASNYAQRKMASESQPAPADNTMRWIFIGGAALAAVVLVVLVVRKSE